MNNDDEDDDSMDALAFLHADHEKVMELFREFDSLKGVNDQDARKSEIVDEICYELQLHTMIEEELFYPAVRAATEREDMIDDAEVEHAGAKDLISQLEIMYPGDEHYEATVSVLNEEIERHIESEELNIFPAARSANLDMQEIGERLAARKQELEEDFTAPPASATAKRADGGRRPQRPPN